MLSFFPRDVLDEILDLIGSVSEGFHSGRGLAGRKLVQPPPPTHVILLLAVPRRLFSFGSLLILDVVCRYLSLFFLYINIKIGKDRC